MADENDDAQDNDVQQNDNTQQQDQVNQSSTGDKQWDDIIDKAAGIDQGQQQDGTQQRGKATDGTQQGDQTQQRGQRTQQQDQNRQQRGQGDDQDSQTQQTRSPARKFGDLFRSDMRGDIYDANGSLIARQGAQRAIFHRLYPTIEAQGRELGALRSRLENYENANQLAKKEGLSLDEQGAALQMFVSWKKDPVKTMQALLTMAEQGGRDVSAIRQGQGTSVADIRNAVQEIVQEAIKPFSFLTEQQQQQAEHQQLLDEVNTEYESFIQEFPDAKVHEQSIANVMRDHNVSHREAYFAVRAFAAERGLNWQQPLAPQLQKQQGRNPSGGGNNRPALPRMGGRNRVEETHVEEGALDQANANDSWDAIARRAMAKAGIQV